MTDPVDSTAPRLLTPAFLILGVTSLVFFVAGGVVLPVVTPFATGPLGSDRIGAGVAYGAFAVCFGRSSAGRRIASAVAR